MGEKKRCHRCGAQMTVSHLWMGKYWCADCFHQQTGLSAAPDLLPQCALCGEEMLTAMQHRFFDEPVCVSCLLRLGPDRAQLLVKIKKLDPGEVSQAVGLLRTLLNQNQTLRLREAIQRGGRNWWVKLPDFGEYICRYLSRQGIGWGEEVLDEIWDQLVEEAVEE